MKRNSSITTTEAQLSSALQEELQQTRQELLTTQTQLEISRKKYEELYDFAPVGCCTFNRRGVILEANLTIAEQLAVARSFLLNTSFLQYIAEEDRESFQEHLRTVFETHTHQTCIIRLCQKYDRASVLLKSSFVQNHEGLLQQCRTAITDISEFKHTEKALRESEERYKTLVENLQQKIFHKDRNSAYVTCNENYARDLHISPEEIVGKTDYDFFPHELAEKYRTDDRKILESGCSLNLEEAYIQNGREIIIQTIKTPIKNSEGKIIGLLGIFWAITERKRAQEDLQQRTHELAERVKELDCLYNLANLVEKPGISVEEILQGTVDLIPQAWKYPEIACVRVISGDLEFKTQNFRETLWKQSAPLKVYGEPIGTLEVGYLEERPEKGEGPFLIEERRLLNAIAERLGRIIERKQTTKALQVSEQRNKLLVETMNDGLSVLNEQADFTYMNDRFCKMVGYTSQELLGRSSFTIIDSKRQELHREQLSKRQQGEFGTYETVLTRKDGSQLPVILAGSPLFDEAGKYKGALGVFTDITKLKQTEQALRESETRYRQLFEDSPISLWEEDFSSLRTYLKSLRDSGIEDYITYFESNPEDIVKCAGMVTVTDVNKATLTLYKAENKKELLTNLTKIFNKESYTAFKKEIFAFLEGKTTFEVETTNLTLEGDIIYVRVKYSIAPGHEETLAKILVSIIDLTEQKQVERELMQERELMRTLMDNSPDHIYFKDTESRFIRTNKAMADWVHVKTPQQALGKTDYDLFAAEHARRTRADEQHIMKTGQPLISKEEKEVWSDGHESWVSTTKMPLRDKTGQIIGTFGISRDITTHKQADERQQLATCILALLNRSSQETHTIRKILLRIKQFTGFEAIGIRLREGEDFPYYETCGFSAEFVEAERFLCVPDPNGELCKDSKGNPYLECMCGNILCGRTDPSLPFFSKYGSFWTNSTSELLASTTEADRQARTRNRCHGEGYESVALIPLRSANRIIGLMQFNDRRKNMFSDEIIVFFESLGASIGIALEHQQAEEEMARLRNFLKNIIDSMPLVLIGVDHEGRITHWNLQAEKMTGMSSENAQRQMLIEVFPQLSSQSTKIQQAIQQHLPQKDEKVLCQIQGEKHYLDIKVYPLIAHSVNSAVICVDDVTERVHLEELMIQSEKMISVGKLAAGVAHEINNPLAGMLQNAEVILNRLTQELTVNTRVAEECGISMKMIREYAEKRDIVKMLELIRASGERAAQIVGDMLSFSRKSESYMTPHDIRDLLDKTVELVSNLYDLKKKCDFRTIEIVREYAPDLPRVFCEPTKIQQVFLNLLTNAAHAMAESAYQQRIPKLILRTILNENKVCVEIEDNGPGMPEYVRKRIFEPFFTTKKVGSGTGLGLSVSYFIITDQHGGTMNVASAPEKGTKFVICLPIEKSR